MTLYIVGILIDLSYTIATNVIKDDANIDNSKVSSIQAPCTA